jgi:hypothetical protein
MFDKWCDDNKKMVGGPITWLISLLFKRAEAGGIANAGRGGDSSAELSIWWEAVGVR